MFIMALGRVMEFRVEQLENVLVPVNVPNAVPRAGSDIDASDVHPLNVKFPVIVFNEFTVTEERPVQLLNMELPEMVVRAGNDIDARVVHPSNTLDPIRVCRAVSVTVFRDIQFCNALFAIEVASGKVTVVIPVQPWNADAPIVTRLFAVMDVIPVWPLYRLDASSTTVRPAYVLIVIVPNGVPDAIEFRRHVPFPKSVKLYTTAISIYNC